MKILFKEPNKEFKTKEIENDLKTLQQLVGGYIEVIPYRDNIVIVLDEEGKLKGKEPNICFPNDILVGNCIFVGTKDEDCVSLTDEQRDMIIKGI